MLQPRPQRETSVQESTGDMGLQFCWGLRKGAINLYESFTLNGTEYSLYDCVYVQRTGQTKPDIGKLVRIWETEKREKKIEVVWFFRPTEIARWLGDIKPVKREIFLACGQGRGLSSLDTLEAISGKCNIICSSKHQRNPQPTEEDLRMADHIFYRTFDVGKYIISEMFPRLIGGIEVNHFFNRRKDSKPSDFAEPKPNSKSRSEETPVITIKNDQSARVGKGLKLLAPSTGRQINNSAKDGPRARTEMKTIKCFRPVSSSDVSPMKKRRLLVSSGPTDGELPYLPSRVSVNEKRLHAKDSLGEKKDLSTRGSLDEKGRSFSEKGAGSKLHVSQTISYKYREVTRRPDMDSSKWFKLEVWEEERLREANEKGTLVLLENFDPSFTSAEVEDIIWHVFGQKVKAKMVQQTAVSSPHSAQAFAIFKTKEAADDAISQLTNGCLVLGDGRPIVGQRRSLRKFDRLGRFVGHLTIDKTRPQRQREEIRNAVATSHFSQSNTIEFEMAIEWCLLEAKSDLWWTALHEEQGKEIEASMKRMKTRHPE